MGIAMEARTDVGETAGGLQAPHVVKIGDLYHMFYGDWENICVAASENGKTFTRRLNTNGKTGMFSEGPGNNTRDPMVIRIKDTWHCYYTAYPNKQGAVYCRTSKDTRAWSESKVVAFGGEAGTNAVSAECPFVVELTAGEFYLFRTQRYGQNGISRVYHSHDPLDFGIDNDRDHLLANLPVAAPELIRHDNQWYIASLLPSLKGIRVARLSWSPKAD
jgi:sucrose-6-phosphate hydrolase SacC (GH32 family)